LAGIGSTPAALQCGLPQVQPSAVGHHPQLIPAPLQHRRGDVDPIAAYLQAGAFSGNRKSRPAIDRQHRLWPAIEQPGLHAKHDRARIGKGQQVSRRSHAT